MEGNNQLAKLHLIQEYTRQFPESISVNWFFWEAEAKTNLEV
jgi:hypothetical protein